MVRKNSDRPGCQDVFHAFLVQDAEYDGDQEIPKIAPIDSRPNRMIPFSKIRQTNDYNQWVHFYEDDASFERVWANPRQYLPILKRFNGVISPDFSLFRDMPLVQQEWNTYRGKALGHWWQKNGILVIPNVRTADERSYMFCCNGVARSSIIAVGSHGCLKYREERLYFQRGLEFCIEQLCPKTVVVYGAAPRDVFFCCYSRGIEVIQFDSEFASSRKDVSA